MSKKDKLIKRLKTKPKDFTYDELKTLLEYLGFEEDTRGKTSGSRVEFIYKGIQYKVIKLHKPHPSNILKEYVVKNILDKLKEIGVI